jgi:hypothetical protein
MDREQLLILTSRNDGMGHPFRQSLPVEKMQITGKTDVSEASATPRGQLGEDVSLFLLSFLAFFTAFYTFIF